MGGDIRLLPLHALKARTGKTLPSFCSSDRLCTEQMFPTTPPTQRPVDIQMCY